MSEIDNILYKINTCLLQKGLITEPSYRTEISNLKNKKEGGSINPIKSSTT